MNLQLIGQGKTTKVYHDGDKAIKLYVNAPPDEAYNEAKRQTFAVESGLPVPKVFGVRNLDNGVALEMEYIAGMELVRPKMDKDERRNAFKRFVHLQNEVHRIDASGEPLLSQRLMWKIEQAPHLDKTTKDILINRLAELDNGKTCLCHGDFHTSNVLDDGRKLWIIDWVDSACGDPFADVCRSYLIFKHYISRMAGIYLKEYCELNTIDQEVVLAWLPIIAAARLRENLDAKETSFVLEIIKNNKQI